MFKSDKPLQLDSTTGSVVGGLPGAAIMEEVMFSDGIIGKVIEQPQFKSQRKLLNKSPGQLAQIARRGLRFRTLTDEKDSRERLVASVGFEYGDGEVCEGAVAAFSKAIEQYFASERQSSVNELKRLIGEAQTKLLEPQQNLEDQYKAFRQSAQLQWGPEGQLINPYREKQFQLQSQEIQLEQELRDLVYSYQLAEKVQEKRKDDPVMIAEIIGQMPGNQFTRPIAGIGPGRDLIAPDDDLTLQKMEVEKSLLPLEVKLEELRAQYADSHPQVMTLATQVESTQRKLNELNARVLERKRELQSERDQVDPNEIARTQQIQRANRAIQLYFGTIEEKIALKERQIGDIQKLIATQKSEADKLKNAEDEDASFQRKLVSLRGMQNQLERQLAGLRLVDEQGGITVKPMLSASNAFQTGPNLASDLIIYGMVGLGVGALLSMLIEASAKMFPQCRGTAT